MPVRLHKGSGQVIWHMSLCQALANSHQLINPLSKGNQPWFLVFHTLKCMFTDLMIKIVMIWPWSSYGSLGSSSTSSATLGASWSSLVTKIIRSLPAKKKTQKVYKVKMYYKFNYWNVLNIPLSVRIKQFYSSIYINKTFGTLDTKLKGFIKLCRTFFDITINSFPSVKFAHLNTNNIS